MVLKCWYGVLVLVTIGVCITSYIYLDRIPKIPIFASQEKNTTNLPSSTDDALKISVSKNTSTNNVVVLVKPTRESYQNASSEKEAGRVITGYESDRNTSQTWKVLLLYTAWFGMPWPEASKWMKNKTKCQFKCRLTTNKRDLVMSDAVMFHGPDMPRNVSHLKSIRIPQQRWIYFTMENYYNNLVDAALFNGLFNWTMTYRRDSDVYRPYGKFENISENKSLKDQNIINYAKTKTRLIAWAVSHCNTSGKRDDFVKEFSKFVPVSIYGKCRGLFPKRDNINEEDCPRSSPECSNRLMKFKFYLALENGMCLDYITEKYWHRVQNIIPIVIGPPYYSELAIPGSYINALDFPSIEALANYIKYLDKNDTAYNEYFRWKSKYQVNLEGGSEYLCKACKKIHTGTQAHKVYNNLGSFWSKTHCTQYLSLLDKFWKYD